MMRSQRPQAKPLAALFLIGVAACGDDSETAGGTTLSSSGAAGAPTSGASSGAETTTGSAGDGGNGGDVGQGGGPGGGPGGGVGGEAGGGGGAPPGAADGEPCASHDACEGGACLIEGATGHPGGMCASPCDPDDPSTCDGFCAETGSIGFVCLASCLDDPAACREGYSCTRTSDFTHFFCTPACSDDAQCPGTGRCGIAAGKCVVPETDCENLLDDNLDGRPDCADPDCMGTPACEEGDVALGDACVRHADCVAPLGIPLCLSEERTGLPGGACARICNAYVDGAESSDCGAGLACGTTPVFDEDGERTYGLGARHCSLATCSEDAACRDGYGCCQGPACTAARQDTCYADCVTPEVCTLPGSACVTHPLFASVCGIPRVEICDNGTDDDGNSDSDCADDACAGSCTALAEQLCADAPMLAATQAGETVPGPGIGGRSCLSTFDVGTVSPQVFAFVAGATGDLVLTLTSTLAQAISVVDGCALGTSDPLACGVDNDFDGTVELTVPVVSGANYSVLVLPVSPGHEDAFVLAAEMP